MSRWKDQFKESNIELNVSNVEKKLKLVAFSKVGTPFNADIRRLRLFTKTTLLIVKKIDQDIAPMDAVTAIASVFNNIYNHLINFQQNNDLAQITAAANQVNNAIPHVTQLTWSTSDNPVFSHATLTSLQKKSEDNIATMSRKRTEFTKGVNALKMQIRTQDKKIKSLDREANRRVLQLEKLVATNDKKLTQLRTSMTKDFQADQRKKNTAFNSYFSSFKKDAEQNKRSTLSKYRNDVDNQKKAILSDLDSIKESAKTKHGELISIVGLASGDAIRGQHKIASEQEEAKQNFWRNTSMGSLAFAIIYVGITSLTMGMSVDTSISVAPMLILLLSGAAYTARLAAGHRREAIRIRQFSLEMEAILPYLDALERSPSDSKELRNKLAEKFFGNLPPVEAGQHKNEAQLSDSTVQKAIEALSKATNKFKDSN